MNDAVALLLLQRLFPAWTITRDAGGIWRATISSGDLDGLLARLTAADPDAAGKAVRVLKESR